MINNNGETFLPIHQSGEAFSSKDTQGNKFPNSETNKVALNSLSLSCTQKPLSPVAARLLGDLSKITEQKINTAAQIIKPRSTWDKFCDLISHFFTSSNTSTKTALTSDVQIATFFRDNKKEINNQVSLRPDECKDKLRNMSYDNLSSLFNLLNENQNADSPSMKFIEALNFYDKFKDVRFVAVPKNPFEGQTSKLKYIVADLIIENLTTEVLN